MDVLMIGCKIPDINIYECFFHIWQAICMDISQKPGLSSIGYLKFFCTEIADRTFYFSFEFKPVLHNVQQGGKCPDILNVKERRMNVCLDMHFIQEIGEGIPVII